MHVLISPSSLWSASVYDLHWVGGGKWGKWARDAPAAAAAVQVGDDSLLRPDTQAGQIAFGKTKFNIVAAASHDRGARRTKNECCSSSIKQLLFN